MRSRDTMVFLASAYPDLGSAKQDYQAVQDLYYETNSIDALDVAVVGKQDIGKVKIFKKHEQPTSYGALVGEGWGLATGLAVALFPDSALGMGFLVGSAAACAGNGAISGHVARGLGWENLRTLGEILESADAGVVAVATTDAALHVQQVMSQAKQVELREAVIDMRELEKDIRDAYREAVA